jgi:hypothetical protein
MGITYDAVNYITSKTGGNQLCVKIFTMIWPLFTGKTSILHISHTPTDITTLSDELKPVKRGKTQ